MTSFGLERPEALKSAPHSWCEGSKASILDLRRQKGTHRPLGTFACACACTCSFPKLPCPTAHG
eukprot:scaffold43898_cov33-Phaeocystis_antarctica.AAC.1